MKPSTPALKWFENFQSDFLVITEFEKISGSELRKLSISDTQYIYSLQSEINLFPLEGDLFKDLSENSKHTTLEFIHKSGKSVIEFYDSRIKTPSNSFFKNSRLVEKAVYDEIQSLFTKPKFDIKTPYFVGCNLDFGEMIVTYEGLEDRTPEGTTASYYVQTFKVKSKSNDVPQLLEVSSGQLPPAPVDFTFQNKKYTINVFSYNKERLHPRFLVISKKSN